MMILRMNQLNSKILRKKFSLVKMKLKKSVSIKIINHIEIQEYNKIINSIQAKTLK